MGCNAIQMIQLVDTINSKRAKTLGFDFRPLSPNIIPGENAATEKSTKIVGRRK